MTLRQRPYSGEDDWPAIADLIAADPAFQHRVDFPWRLCSTSLENHQNAAVWESEEGQMQIIAALQFPWLTLDYAIAPDIRTWEIEALVIGWAEARLSQIAAETDSHFPFNVSAFAHERARISFLEGLGYTRWNNHVVVLSRSLATLAEPHLPQGFAIRPLAGEGEIEGYADLHRTAFDSMVMTADWRRRTLRAPLYNPTIDLVAVSPYGQLAGFCVWWYDPRSKTAQIEPLGVHPDFQRLGLGQALMAEGLRRLAALGTEMALVETYSFSQTALLSYAAAGFQEKTQEFKFYKNYHR